MREHYAKPRKSNIQGVLINKTLTNTSILDKIFYCWKFKMPSTILNPQDWTENLTKS